MTDNKEALGTSQDAQATSEPFPAPPTPEQIAEWEAEGSGACTLQGFCCSAKG